MIAEFAASFDDEVHLAVGDKDPVDARSPLLIMSLGVGFGETVEVIGDSPGAVDAIAT
ncbi:MULTISPECIES: HPr family phosphocarrier protein [Nocardioides]|uniref:HPr family phosphocarrier protein n=1 Tax=Nocardioides TaxID=1839 RepID=UPI001E5E1096|nr:MULTISPECIES: HPr family phosphocarrier protein [Nocardioides]